MTCLLALTAASAQAQQVTLSPSVIELKGAVGQSTTQKLTMTNQTNLELAFDLKAEDVVTTGGKRVFLPAGDIPHSIAATAVFSPSQVVVPAHESRSVTITVTVPPDVATRAIVALFKGTTIIGGGARSSTVSLGALLTFTLSDAISVQPSELFVMPQSDARNAGFEIAFNNGGAEPVTPKGIVVILNADGSIAGKTAFAPQRVLPGERVTFHTEYPGELRSGRYRVLSTFEFAGQALTRSGALVVQ
jgi:hypothetical protein